MIDLAQEIKRVHDNIGRARRAGLPATLTPLEWLDNVKLFNGLCAYCGEVPFSVLDHLTGEVRGFLCRRCNLAEGLLKDYSDEQFQHFCSYRSRYR